MAADIRFTPATRAHLVALSQNTMPGFEAEVAALGRTPLEALLAGLRPDAHVWAVTLDGALAVVVGARPIGPSRAQVWYVPSRVVETKRKDFVRAMRLIFPALAKQWPNLLAYAQSDIGVRVAKHLGFRVMAPVRQNAATLYPCVYGGEI